MTSMAKLLEAFRQPLHEAAKDYTDVFERIKHSLEDAQEWTRQGRRFVDDPKQLQKYMELTNNIEQNAQKVKLIKNPHSTRSPVFVGYGFSGPVQHGLVWLSHYFPRLSQTTNQRMNNMEQVAENLGHPIEWDEMTILIKGKHTAKAGPAMRPACQIQFTGEMDDGTELITNVDTAQKMGSLETIIDGIKYTNQDAVAIKAHYQGES